MYYECTLDDEKKEKTGQKKEGDAVATRNHQQAIVIT